MGGKQSGFSHAEDDNVKGDLDKFEPKKFVDSYDDLTSAYFEEEEDDSAFIEKMWKHFHEVYPDGHLRKTEFVRDNMKMKGGKEEFWGGIFEMIDTDKGGSIDFREYLIFLMLSRGTSTEKTLELIFRMLDTDGSKFLEREEIEVFFNVLIDGYDKTIRDIYKIKYEGEETREEKLKIVIEETFKKMDENNDGLISMEEFVTFIKREPEFKKIFVNSFDQTTVLYGQKKIEEGDLGDLKKRINSGGSGFFNSLRIEEDETKVRKPLFEIEYLFYEEFVTKLTDESEKSLFLNYYGRETVKNADQLELFLILEDLTHKYEKPSSLILKTSLTGRKGGKVKMKHLNEVKVYRKREDRFYSFCVKANVTEDLLSKFLYNGTTWYISKINEIVLGLKRVRKFVKKYRKEYNFDQCGLLILYEGCEEDIYKPKGGDVMVKMIDFEDVEKRDEDDDEEEEEFNTFMLSKLETVIDCFGSVSDEYDVAI